MNKDYFLRELEYLLSDLSEEERESALEYYSDYLEEAGPEQEEEMIRRLGSPEKVAAQLKAALAGDTDGGEFSERGFRDDRFEADEQIPDHYTEIVAGEVIEEEASDRSWQSRTADRGRRRRSGALLFLVLFCIFGLPLAGSIVGAGFSIVAALIGVVFGILGGLFGLIIGGFASVAGLFAAGIGTVIAGFCNWSAPAIATMSIGAGFFMIAGSFLLLIIVKWACGIAVPGIIRMCIALAQKLIDAVKRLLARMFGKRGETR